MRLPLSKVYRAFPELDEFEDDQCERFVQWARSRIRLRRFFLPFLAVVLWVMLVAVVAPMVFWLLPSGRRFEWLLTLAILAIAAALVWSIAVALLVRDWVLIRAIRYRIRGGRCPECRFSLLGLPIHDGAIVCPECGTDMTLHELGLTPRDLLVEED